VRGFVWVFGGLLQTGCSRSGSWLEWLRSSRPVVQLSAPSYASSYALPRQAFASSVLGMRQARDPYGTILASRSRGRNVLPPEAKTYFDRLSCAGNADAWSALARKQKEFERGEVARGRALAGAGFAARLAGLYAESLTERAQAIVEALKTVHQSFNARPLHNYARPCTSFNAPRYRNGIHSDTVPLRSRFSKKPTPIRRSASSAVSEALVCQMA